jgi:hypothetical protein
VSPFTYEPPSLVETLRDNATGLALLALWAAASVVAALFAVRNISERS